MKIKTQHFDELKSHIQEKFKTVILSDLIDAYEKGNFQRSDKVQDLQKRFCFDVLYSSVPSSFISVLYEYLNDAHIYTALKKICPSIVKKY